MPSSKPLLLTAASIDIQAASEAGKPPRVSIIAYGGGAMKPPGWGWLAIELKGLLLSTQVPLLADHDGRLSGIVGHATPRVDRNQLVAAGNLVPGSEAADRILELAKGGLTFGASVGVEPLKLERVRAGETIAVNGRSITFADEGVVVRAGRLREITITAVGADPDASVDIAASLKGITSMDFQTWLQANGFVPEQISDQQRPALEAAWKADTQTKITLPATAVADDPAERNRLDGIRAACNGQHQAIEAQAIRENWDINRTRLEVIRASRSAGPGIHVVNRVPSSTAIIEAGLLCRVGLEAEAVRAHGEATVDAARLAGITNLVDVCRASLALDGRDIPSNRDALIKASFSTLSLPGILGNVANKSMLAAYNAFPSVARLVARKLSANDFKQATGYRLTGAFQFEEVGPTGELVHGEVAESSFTYRVATFGKMFGVDRPAIINDDLGALDSLPQLIGRGAAQKLENLFWALVLANTGSFFSEAAGNQISDVLGIPGLTAAVLQFRKLVDSTGEPISVVPKSLVVPPELEQDASALYSSQEINSPAETEDQPNGNPWFNKFPPSVAPHLSSSTVHADASETAWYLFGPADDVAAFGIAYLNGQEAPTVEMQDAPFNTLGVQYRGYLDMGVCQIDTKGAVMSTGEGAE